MKKIISMLCVVAMMFSFAVISANAAGTGSFSLVKNEALTTADQLAFDIVLNYSEAISNSTIQLGYADIMAANTGMQTGDFAIVKSSANTMGIPNNNAGQKFLTISYTDTTGAITEVTIATITINTANFKNDAAFIKRAACAINSNRTITASGLDIKAPVSGPTEVGIAASIEKLVGEVTEKQDYAYAADITVEGNPTQLIWSVLDGTRKYSAAQPVAGVAGNVKVGFVSENNYDATTMGVLLTNEAKDTIWYSVEADLANEAE